MLMERASPGPTSTSGATQPRSPGSRSVPRPCHVRRHATQIAAQPVERHLSGWGPSIGPISSLPPHGLVARNFRGILRQSDAPLGLAVLAPWAFQGQRRLQGPE